MADIFISYARSDRPRVQPLVARLEAEGWSVWWDRDLVPGSAYERAIDDAISDARVVIVAWSAESVESEWVQAEAGDGLDRHILVPVLLDDVRVPISFRRKHAARLIGWPADHDEREIRNLLRAVGDCLQGISQVAGGSATPRPQSAPPRRRAWWLVSAGVAAVFLAVAGLFYLAGTVVRISVEDDVASVLHAETQSVAVLPFIDSQGGGGISELRHEIARLLSDVVGLQVLASEVVEANLAEVNDPVTSGRRLAVQFVVAGTVDRTRRIPALQFSLINTLNGGVVQTERLNLGGDDLAGVPEKAVRIVTRSLGIDVPSNLAVEGNVNNDAYLAYLSGKAEQRRSSTAPENRRKAEEFFRSAISEEPRFGPAYAGLCQLYINDYSITSDPDAFDSAEKQCNRALTVNPESSDVLAALGSLYRVSGLYDQALVNYQRAIELKPFDADAMRGLAEVYSDMGRAAEAEKVIRTVILIEPTHWQNHRLLGRLFFSAGRYREAAEEFQLEAELSPDKASPMLNLGSALYFAGDFEAAISAWKVSAAIDGDAGAYSNLGAAEFFSGNFPEAAKMYELALTKSPKQHEIWGNAAEAYFFDGSERAHDYYRTALELTGEQLKINPDDYVILSARALYLSALDRADPALETLRQALSLRGDDPYTWYDAARVHARLGKRVDAINALQQALGLGYPLTLATADANFKDFVSEIGENNDN